MKSCEARHSNLGEPRRAEGRTSYPLLHAVLADFINPENDKNVILKKIGVCPYYYYYYRPYYYPYYYPK